MREFKKHRTKQEEWFLLALKCAGALVLLAVTLASVRAAWGMYGKMVASSHARDEAQAQLKRVETQRSGVHSTLTEITSTRGVERQIRERYGVVRPGEGEIDVIRDTKTATTTEKEKTSWWQRVFRTLFVW